MLQENTAVLETSREGKFSLTFESHHVSWNQTIHLSVRIRTLLIVLLSQVNAVRILPSYIFKVRINIILLCSKVCLPFIFQHQTPLCIYFPCTPRPPHRLSASLVIIDMITVIIFGEGTNEEVPPYAVFGSS